MKTNKQKATQRVATIGIIARHGRRCNNALGGVFAEQKLQRTKLTWMLILFAMITIAFIACKNDDGGNDIEQPKVQPDTPRTLSFGTDCKVTIKSDDTFLTAEWTTLCNSVVAAIMRGYNKDMGGDLPNAANKNRFTTIFAKNISIVLLKSATYDCEVKDGNYTTIYLKTSAIDTVDIQPAIFAIDASDAYHNP